MVARREMPRDAQPDASPAQPERQRREIGRASPAAVGRARTPDSGSGSGAAVRGSSERGTRRGKVALSPGATTPRSRLIGRSPQAAGLRSAATVALALRAGSAERARRGPQTPPQSRPAARSPTSPSRRLERRATSPQATDQVTLALALRAASALRAKSPPPRTVLERRPRSPPSRGAGKPRPKARAGDVRRVSSKRASAQAAGGERARKPEPGQEPEPEPEPEPRPLEPEPEPEPAPQLKLRFEPAPEPEPETSSFESGRDGAQARAVLSAAQMQEWSEARVLEWAESVALSADDVEVVKRAFVDDGGVDGDELAHMRPRSLQKLLRRTGSRDPEALADAVLQERDRAVGQTPAAPHVGRRWTRPGDHAGRARQPFLELVSSPATSHASDLDDAHDMRGAERLQRNPSYEVSFEPPISPRSSASDFSPRSDASSIELGERLERRVLYCLSTENPLRRGAVWLKGATWFERPVLVLIVANCVIISLQVPSCGDAQASCELMGEAWNVSRCEGDAAAVDQARIR